MNDGVFASYENFMCLPAVAFQPTELAPSSVHTLDHEYPSSPHFFAGKAPTDMQAQQKLTKALPGMGPGSGGSAGSATSSAAAKNANNRDVFAASIPSIPSIPFVQIHTTNVRPQRSSFGNVFRRSTASHEEIKSEPIKSESADAAKERVNTTPAPQQSGNHVITPILTPIPNSQSATAAPDTAPLTNDADNTEMSTVGEVAETRRSLPKLHKCQRCPFLSLSRSSLETHQSNAHSVDGDERERERVACPGCTNVFYALHALETHLRADHIMMTDDARQLLQAITGEGTIGDESRHQPDAGMTSAVAAIAARPNEHPQQQRSRIYLKNVECLREPRRATLEQQHQIADSGFFPTLGAFTNCGGSGGLAMDVGVGGGAVDFMGLLEDVANGAIDQNGNNGHSNNNNNNNNDSNSSSSSCNNNNNNIMMSVVCGDAPELGGDALQSQAPVPAKKQNISIKSVDVLREPALLRRDYDIQNNSFNNFITACSELELNALDGGSQQQYGCTYGPPASVVGTLDNGVGTIEGGVTTLNFEKTRRRPKIYIKNVDILKKPLILSGSLGASNLTAPSYGYMQQSLPPGEGDFMGGNGGGSEEVVDSLSGSATAFDGGLATLSLPLNSNGLSEQYLFENSSVGYLPTIGGDHDGFSFVNATNGGGGVGNFLDCDLNSGPLITEPTPPPLALSLPLAPPPTLDIAANVEPTSPPPLPPLSLPLTCPPQPEQRQKIFIKNVDILKQPQFQEQRGTLHLRTVDELNLMNKNEVENLIAPNLDNMPMAGGSAELTDETGEETLAGAKLDAEDDTLFDAAGHFKLHDFDGSVANTWNDDYDLGEDIDCIITATIAPNTPTCAASAPSPTSPPTPSMANVMHELEAPSVSHISIRDIEELTGTQHHHAQQHQHQHLHRSQPDLGGQLERQEPLVSDITSHFTMSLQPMLPLEPLEVLKEGAVDAPIELSPSRPLPLSLPPPQQPTKLKRPTAPQKVAALPSVAKTRDAAVELTAVHFGEMPPLVPMTHLNVVTTAVESSAPAAVAAGAIDRDLVSVTGRITLPPLVPVSPLIHQLKAPPAAVAVATSSITSTAAPISMPVTTARIYVASNLMQVSPEKTSTAPPPPKLQPVPRSQVPLQAQPAPQPLAPQLSQLAPQSQGTLSSQSAPRPQAHRPQSPPQIIPLARIQPAPQSQLGVESQSLAESVPQRRTQPPRQAQTSVRSESPPSSAAVIVTGGMSVRGRPFGSNRTGITKLRKLNGPRAEHEAGAKCAVHGCAFRFKRPETLAYHQRCHGGGAASSQLMQCPECRSMNFTNWNTLHTHLWRSHHIDMELYSCELCAFKTPVYSRLINTHSKIHFDARNYKCDQCAKAFKNTKQLKNHRRWHRNHAPAAVFSAGAASYVSGNVTQPDAMPPPLPPPDLHRCNECDAVFSHQKTLREHQTKHGASPAQCDVCGRCFSSRSSLRLHMLTHMEAKRFKCDTCAYTANDHNAFRRHKMTHENTKTYTCPHCSYKSIQSMAFQKHVQLKHPEVADSIVHKCSRCPFATINRMLFVVHQAKHEASNRRRQTAIATAAVDVLAAPPADAIVFVASQQQQIQTAKAKSTPEQPKNTIQVKRGERV